MTVAILGFTSFIMIMFSCVIVGKKLDEKEGNK